MYRRHGPSHPTHPAGPHEATMHAAAYFIFLPRGLLGVPPSQLTTLVRLLIADRQIHMEEGMPDKSWFVNSRYHCRKQPII